MGKVRPSVFGLQDEPDFPGRASRSARLSFWGVWKLRDLMGSHCGKYSTNIHPSSHQTTFPMVLQADGILLLAFSWMIVV